MKTRARSLPLVYVIVCVALLQSVHGAVLEGHTIAVVNFHGTAPDSTQVIGPIEAVVGAGTEFVNFGWSSFVDIDVSDARIVITLNIDQPFGYSEVLRFMDPNGLLPDFTGATVNPATTYAGFNQSLVLVTPNVIDIYLTGLQGLQDQQITLDLTAVASPSLPTAAADTFATSFNTTLVVPAPGVLINDSSNGGGPMTANLNSVTTDGALALNADGSFTYTPNAGFSGPDSFTYRAVNSAGLSDVAAVTIQVASSTVPLPPVGLRVASVVGNQVTLRWSLIAGGLVPTNFVLEAGLSPGEVLASVPTGSASPIFTFTAPTGSFFVRVRTESGPVRSEPSNEIPIHVNVPVPPSAPADLLALVDGSSAVLVWKNTFGGGVPSSVILDVTGAVTMSVPLGLVESIAADAIPAGTYHVSLRAANAAGSSAPSNQVTMSFPGPCSGAPLPPTNFLAYTIGRTVVVVWDPAATGPAPTGYMLNVSGTLTAVFSTTVRTVRGTAPPGSYALSVHATNSCGASEPTATQTVVVP
jgi:hypothetical protein